MMRNLGIIAGFEVVQRLQQVPDHGYAWPPGKSRLRMGKLRTHGQAVCAWG